jgi:hypothetical protein
VLAVVDHVPRRAVGRLPDEDAVRGSGRLQAGRRVDDVARNHSFASLGAGVDADQRLAGVDGGANLERAVLDDAVADGERRTHRALGVVLVRERRAEDSHHRVADELLHRASALLELFAQALVIRAEDRLDVLRVERLSARGEADEVREQHRHDLPLAARCYVHTNRSSRP